MSEENYIEQLQRKLLESQRETGKKFGGLAEGVGNAIDDIRSKLVEEGWFGRTVSPQVEVSKEAVKIPSLDEMQEAMGYGRPEKSPEQEQERSRGPSR